MIGNVTIEELNRRGQWMTINARDDAVGVIQDMEFLTKVEAEKIQLKEHDVNFFDGYRDRWYVR